MQDLCGREPSLSKKDHAFPVQVMALTAAPERLEPAASHLSPEGLDCPAVARHCVIGKMPSQHAGQPLALLGNGQMPVTLELVVDLGKLGPHPFGDRDAPEPEPSAPALPADVREAHIMPTSA